VPDFDAVVVGSGFGGAVAACRLAEAAQRVLVLERGRRWDETSYPSVTNQDWVFDVDEPERENGWLDLRWFDDMAVAQGAGVGGGSLVYANVSVPPPRSTFEEGWPEAITFDALAPYVDRVGDMLEVATLPERQLTRRWHFVRRGAEALGHSDRFASLPLAVHFDPDYEPAALTDPHADRHAKPYTNRFGARQRSCIHLGDCDMGCRVRAKNTLDLNYLARATARGAEIRPLHLVRAIERDGAGWRVRFDEIADGRLRPGSVSAGRVVLAAGSLGSTELMLRSALPGVSARLGHGWSPNGDFLTPAVSSERADPTVGPTITARIDHTDGQVYGQKIFIQDGGLPNLLRSSVSAWQRRLPRRWRSRVRAFVDWAGREEPLDRVMPWFAQGIDASDGRLCMRRRFFGLGSPRLSLDWDIARSKPTIDAIVEAHTALAEATGGRAIVSPTWSWLRDLITPHPLGGCNMADDASRGVVDHAGRVFGEPGLYVTDGSIIPRAIGRNPSRTIAAVAERAVEQWAAD
jgi:cholesterol oxidase